MQGKFSKRIISLMLVALMLIGALPLNLYASPVTPPEVQPLKDIYKDDFLFGTVVSSGDFNAGNSAKYDFMKYHFNVLTPENEMKPDYLWPNEGNGPTFANADGIVSRAASDGFATHGHALAWHSQSPAWLNTSLTYTQAQANLKKYIEAVAAHYAADPVKVISWDVVNEAMRDNPRNPSDWENALRTRIDGGSKWFGSYANGGNGADYIYDAFLFAREAAPNAVLYYNDYNDDNANKATAIAAMVTDVNARYAEEYPEAGGRKLIEGIGMQAHYNTGVRPENVEASMEKFIACGVEISVTELDITINGIENNDPTVEQLKIQAELYANLFVLYKKYADNIARVTLWGTSDTNSWRSGGFPLPFDGDFQPKESYFAIADPYRYLGLEDPVDPVAPVDKPIGNPYLPLWEHLPDNEPRVFDDPDNPGKFRAYITGSHDVRVGSYCGPDIRQWSAPIENLADWRDEGPIFTYRQTEGANWDTMYAPDIVEVKRFAPDVISRGRTADDERTITEYFLYPHSTSDNGMVARSARPDGPFVPINLGPNGRSQSGSFIGFDPSVWVDYIDDPEDPDYNIGFRAYVYYGFQESNAAELNQDTMWSQRAGTERIRYFMPSSNGYGNVDYANEPVGTEYKGLAPGEDPADFNFFEAASMRKIGNKYIMVYSGHSGPDYGMGSTNSALRWAYGDTPMGPFRFGGVMVDSRGPVPNEDGSRLVGGQWGHNTHGSLWEINGQWYTTYHRPVMGASGNRQAVVAPLKVTYTEPSVLEGGVVTITGYDPYAEDEVWTAKADNGEYDGAEITSEGFHIYGLPPYRYYSAGYVSDHQGSATVQVNRDIWDSHQPIVSIRNGYRAGYKYFGFEGLDEWSKGILPFEGTKEGNGTKFNVWLTPKTNEAFSVQVWLDGPWANDTWNGTQIGTINVPAGSAQEVTRFSLDVAEAVEGLSGKHAVYLVFNGASGVDLCDMMGLGFSSDANEIDRFVPPTVSISLDGEAQEIPSQPVRSTSANGIVDASIYELSMPIMEGETEIPEIAASADSADVTVEVRQAEALNGFGVVTFTYNGVVKTYNVKFVPPPEPRDAYTRIEAETFDDATSGPQNENCSEGGLNVGYISGNSMWLRYNRVDFGENGPVSVITRSAANSGAGTVSVLLDSPNGEVIATGSFSTSGGWQTWTDNVMEIAAEVTGQHDVYLRFNGAQNINWLVFEEAEEEIPPMSFDATMSENEGSLSVSADIFSGPEEIIGARVIAAVYNAAGQLSDVSMITVDIPENSQEIVPFSLDVSSLDGEYSVKAFLWDAETMIPLAESIEPAL